MIRRASGLLAGLLLATAAMGETTYRAIDWAELKGWDRDDHDAALRVFLTTCDRLDGADWQAACAAAAQTAGRTGAGRAFFEARFQPMLITDGAAALFTGYFEPELQGSRHRTATHRWPIYRKPPEVRRGQKWHSRREIEEAGLLEGRGLEIAWIADPVDLFFLHVQGSGRIALGDGGHVRVGFGGRNGHDYRSVGREMARRGLLPPNKVSAAAIRDWVRRNPDAGAEILWHNPSYIFFREIGDVPDDAGPIGALNRSVTRLRSVAVDPVYTPLGAPVWIETDGRAPLSRLMIAQDTGAAIKGAQRADIFMGTGKEAGRKAGTMRDGGRMVTLLPVRRARSSTVGE